MKGRESDSSLGSRWSLLQKGRQVCCVSVSPHFPWYRGADMLPRVLGTTLDLFICNDLSPPSHVPVSCGAWRHLHCTEKQMGPLRRVAVCKGVQ